MKVQHILLSGVIGVRPSNAKMEDAAVRSAKDGKRCWEEGTSYKRPRCDDQGQPGTDAVQEEDIRKKLNSIHQVCRTATTVSLKQEDSPDDVTESWDGRSKTGQGRGDGKLFSIFYRPKKTVYLVRHAQTWLKRYVEPSSSVLESCMFDLALTEVGVTQARDLGVKLASVNADVIISSPLTRALETLQYALPSMESAQSRSIPCHITAVHTEYLQVSGDVGRPPEALATDFPQFDFCNLEPVWWYSDGKAPNDAYMKQFQKREPLQSLVSRIGMFRRFLASRAEATIIVIGHSSFLMKFLSEKKRLANCEWRKIMI